MPENDDDTIPGEMTIGQAQSDEQRKKNEDETYADAKAKIDAINEETKHPGNPDK